VAAAGRRPQPAREDERELRQPGRRGDPFPGATSNTVFHAGSNPSSFTNRNVSTGVTLTEIAEEGGRISFRVLSRYQSLRIRSSGDIGTSTLFTVDGQPVGGTVATIRSAPYQKHTIEAVAGAPLGEGIRRGFAGWRDAPGTSRVRTWSTGLEDAELEAIYGGPRELRLGVSFEGTRYNVVPGKVVSTPASPDLWFAEGTTVALRAQATTGFEFTQWKGTLAGQPNPAVVVMDQPKDATATFDYVFAIEPGLTVSTPAATARDVLFEARNANLPASWALLKGSLPDGLSFQRSGKLTGEAVQTGTYPLELSVTDALGLQATGTITLKVTVPMLGVSALAAPFLRRTELLTFAQMRYLDRSGNNDGLYDLGDFRAYMLANPGAATATQTVDAPLTVPVVDFGPREPR
jgi:hypothetical protein